jgi:phosphatidylserine/phosphatidylglycerophosphate/cardiolipin synthase-like enzyme
MLKRIFLIFILSSFTQLQGCVGSSHPNLISLPVKSVTCPVIHACFTPGQDCTHQITDHISKAKHYILVQAYNFTSKDIADALVEAKNRGVTVKVILDKSQRTQKYSLLHYIVDVGIPVWIDTKPAIAHNKVMIIDEKEVITGSFNFTDAAQKRNAENVVFITDTKLAQEYTDNWGNREHQSTLYSE